jgi:probable HAF family extracellular repeat protein
MKSKTSTRITVVTLFAALAIPVSLVAQGQKGPEKEAPHGRRYRFVEVPTFGGPNFFANFTGAPNRLLNNRGTLVGGADTLETDPFCINNPDCFVMHAFRWRDGVLTDLGTLPGGANSQAFWVNGRGLIAGMSQNGVIDPLLGIQALKAVVWEDGDIVNLGTLEGGYESLAQSINDRGQVTGIALNTIPDPFACCAFFPNTQNRAFLWKAGKMQDLGTLGGPDAQGKFINDRGQISGISYVSFEPTSSGEPQIDPFLWEDGVMMDLGSLGGTFGEPEGLNNRGQVVGDMNLAGDATSHPFLWQRGSLLDLGTLGGSFGLARQVNESGEIVGSATTQNDQAVRAFEWKKGVMTDLGTLRGDDCSIGQNINSRGQIVGASFSCAGGPLNAALWDSGAVIDLNSFVAPSSNLHLIGDDIYINDSGAIAGTGALPNGDIRAFVLIPCEGKHIDDEGCRDEGESIVTETQASSRTITRPANATQGRLTPEMLGALRARLGRRSRIPALGAPRF